MATHYPWRVCHSATRQSRTAGREGLPRRGRRGATTRAGRPRNRSASSPRSRPPPAPRSSAPSGRTVATSTRTGMSARARQKSCSHAKSETGFTILVADDELSPAQQKALESLLNTKVIDRSRLILDIFAQHAQTHEGRLQVELAQLEYQLPAPHAPLDAPLAHRRRHRLARSRRVASWRPTGGSSASASRR